MTSILSTEIFDYGNMLAVKLSDGRTLRLTAKRLAEVAPSPSALRIETLERDRDALLRQLAELEVLTSR